MTATQTTKPIHPYRLYDGDCIVGDYATRADAALYAADRQDARIVKRTVAMRATSSGYVGINTGSGRAIRGTESNAALICRSRSIDAAARLGLPFVE
jgi:hypothetical protein